MFENIHCTGQFTVPIPDRRSFFNRAGYPRRRDLQKVHDFQSDAAAERRKTPVLPAARFSRRMAG
jgi:hypothetical protein